MKRVDDFRLRFGKKEYVPIMIGGMGVDISTSELALEAARLNGIGHISDAMVEDVSDRRFDTTFVKDKTKLYKFNINNSDKAVVQFDLGRLAEAQRLHIGRTMEAKKGDGLIFVNCMEKLTMNGPRETLRVRLNAALDAGIDGITLSAGLHFGSFALIADHPRFRDAKLGIIVSSVRALQIFLRKNAKLDRLPDFIIVEGPLAGGHLGFGMDWANYDLHTITAEILAYLKTEQLDIPLIAAGGIFTGSDAVSFLEAGAAGVQVATRFTVTEECGLPNKVKQEYYKASEEDIIVNGVSPTGYPMRMLKNTPAIGAGIRPGCESYGYLLDATGNCAYINSYNREVAAHPEQKTVVVMDKTCLCTHMRNFNCWTCGHYTYRLKDTTHKLDNGEYQILTAEHVFKDYQFSVDNQIALPEKAVQG
ncbi:MULTISPECIES: nitronate monooxygenase [Janthinobacterium]|jgi:nitronate monooxygenase|uniref:2-nitropropane dioxygenase n=2 Tax=Janthinobacterium TaxID=29580 RepID=A0A1S1U5Q5_9BURK|nr:MULTISPECIES: nitronate monooxygenase [Janthinobacterium]ATD60297.1 nitronate monooxygenase [Janthinobacterium svalbardensis]MDI3297248.1 nitronate monooxygenase [Janthinobacterium tructae]MDN2699453.1 nitronate monooxygenase [Janthinobacterium sp. SUN073]OHV95576.1 2-nitropropane dioxygenase [Janthinobacterium lividum]PIG26723.1 NAD(P)H-dependent flavin oxidoreductase YrpB (nitropropane dioxygenase family) [Janthinobacterium sp. 35]